MDFMEELISDLKSEVVADLKAKIADLDKQKADAKEELISIMLGREWHDMNANPNDVPEIEPVQRSNCSKFGRCDNDCTVCCHSAYVIARYGNNFDNLQFLKGNTYLNWWGYSKYDAYYKEEHFKHDCFLCIESDYYMRIDSIFPVKIDKWISIEYVEWEKIHEAEEVAKL